MRYAWRLGLVVLCGVGFCARGMAAQDAGDEAALAAATTAVCSRDVVMLGESATHGDGHTEAFKVALVERMVNRCGFDSVIFEASHYEFLEIARKLRQSKAVSEAEVAGAIGGLWKFDEEFKPLVPFLLRKAIAGKISLGGMDDQLGEMGQDYANVVMIANLTMVLPQADGEACGLAMHRRIYSEDAEGDGSATADREKITACLIEIRKSYAADKAADRFDDGSNYKAWLEKIDAMQRWIDWGSLAGAQQMVGRDESMFRNFEWLRREEPRRRKVIVWAATVHVAKKGDPTWGDRTGMNFGSLVQAKYGERAFSVGFAALGGSYRQGREVKEQPVAPLDSVEARALGESGAEAVFVGPAELLAMGTRPGAIFRHAYEDLRWSQFVDGVVVFRMERPPVSTRVR
jgi:erythromycin esterase-like protein